MQISSSDVCMPVSIGMYSITGKTTRPSGLQQSIVESQYNYNPHLPLSHHSPNWLPFTSKSKLQVGGSHELEAGAIFLREPYKGYLHSDVIDEQRRRTKCHEQSVYSSLKFKLLAHRVYLYLY